MSVYLLVTQVLESIWISNIRRADLVGKKTPALRHDKLCGIHFENTQFNYFLFYFKLNMDINQCWKWTTIRLFFCQPPFQPSQCWLQIVVVMLICSMLEINDHVVLYCIVRMHLQGLYQHVIPRNLFAYKVILFLININKMVVTVVHMLT